MKKKSPEYLCICLLLRQHLIALLLGYALGIFRDFGRPSGRPIRYRSNPDCACRGAKADHDGSPIGHVPPIHCERAYRHRLSPLSMLEPILP